MKDFRKAIAQLNGEVYYAFIQMIQEYGTDGVLYFEGIANMYEPGSTIIEYSLKMPDDEPDIHEHVYVTWREDDGEIITEDIINIDLQTLIDMYESTYLFLLFTMYNVLPEDSLQNRSFDDIISFLTKYIGIKTTLQIDDFDDFESIDIIDELINMNVEAGIYPEDAINEYTRGIFTEDFDEYNDNNPDADDMKNSDGYIDRITLSVDKDEDGDPGFKVHSENGVIHDVFVPVYVLSALQILYYFNYIHQNQNKIV